MYKLPDGRLRLGKLGEDKNWAELGAQCDAGRDLNARAEFCANMSPLYLAACNGAPASCAGWLWRTGRTSAG